MRANRNAPAGNRGASKVRFVEETATSTIAGFPPPNPVYEAKLAGWLEGFHSRDAEVSRLRYLADLWYYCYANRKTPADFYRHQTDELWREASK